MISFCFCCIFTDGYGIGVESLLSGYVDGAFGSHAVQIYVGRVANDGRVAGNSVRGQVGHFLGHLMRIVGRGEISAEALVPLVKVQRYERNENDDASEPVTAQHRRRTYKGFGTGGRYIEALIDRCVEVAAYKGLSSVFKECGFVYGGCIRVLVVI